MKRDPQHPRSQESYWTLMELVKTADVLKKAGDRFFRGYGLTQSQFNVLILLKYEAPEGSSQTGLSRRMLVNRANMSGLVRRMLRRGLVERADAPGDERAWSVRLSAKGRALLERIEPTYYRRIREVMEGTGGRDLRLFAGLLRRTQERIRQHAI